MVESEGAMQRGGSSVGRKPVGEQRGRRISVGVTLVVPPQCSCNEIVLAQSMQMIIESEQTRQTTKRQINVN